VNNFFSKHCFCSYFVHQIIQLLQSFEQIEQIEHIIYKKYHTHAHKYIYGTHAYAHVGTFSLKKSVHFVLSVQGIEIIRNTLLSKMFIICSILSKKCSDGKNCEI